MGETELAISTLFAAIDRKFVAVSEAAIVGRLDDNADLIALEALVRRLGALHKHGSERLRMIKSRAGAAAQLGLGSQLRPADCIQPPPLVHEDDAIIAVGSSVRSSPTPASPPWKEEEDLPAAIFTGNGPWPAMVEVAHGLEVPAMLLPDTCTTAKDVRDAIRGPMLCYVPQWNHFAVRLGSHILHGNVGRVYAPGTKRPERVKECDPTLCGGPSCTYHHPPQSENPGTHPPKNNLVDVRNFTAESFMYSPRASLRTRLYGGREIGDITSLQEDLRALTPASARMFLDQVAHDLVCAAVILQHRPDLSI